MMPQRPMTTGFPQQTTNNNFNSPSPSGFNSSNLGYGGVGNPSARLNSQPTGYPGQPGFLGGGGIQSQFLSTFMPAANVQPSPYMDPSQMQFAQQSMSGNSGPSLQQSFQARNEQQTGASNVPIPWALQPDEKKRYDQIFRAWDQQGTGFIGGVVAKEVFGQAGLDTGDLMDIWCVSEHILASIQ